MKDLIMKYRDKIKYDFSCSEAMIRAANDYYTLGLGENEFKMMAPFSGGLLEGDLCGILTAACSVLGILYTDEVAHKSPILQEAVLTYKGLFKEEYHSLDCRELVEEHRDETTGCDDLIINGGILLERVVSYIDNKYKK